MLDCRAFGGQAGASARIENYLGFPTGISGMALMARAYNQAQKFGVETAIPDEVVGLDANPPDGQSVLRLSNDERVRARSIVIASGARYRRLAVENLEAFEGSSVHYWASPLEAKLCAGQEVALVGAGNSAGQARFIWRAMSTRFGSSCADRISQRACRDTSSTASAASPTWNVLPQTTVTGLEGSDGMLAAIRWRQHGSGEEVRRPIRHLFLFIGARSEYGLAVRISA